MSIQNLRDKSDGMIAKILVGTIILVFALFGMGSITTFLTPVPKVATVDGEDITQQEMEIAVERSRRMMLAQNISPADIDEDELRSEALQSLINRKLLSQAAQSMKLGYSDQLLDEEIVNTPAFQLDGQFDPTQYQMVLNGAGFTALGYREEMRLDKTFTQLTEAIRGTAFLTQAQVERASSLAQQTRDVAYLRIDVDELIPGIEVSADEISDYYAANQQAFMTAESVDINYVELMRSDLVDAVEVEEADLVAYFEENKALYSEPEGRRLSHILIEVNDQVADAEARALIDEVYAKLQAGEDFATLAKAYSTDPGSAEIGGDLGVNAPGTFVPEFEQAAQLLAEGEMSAPVLTEFGYHLIMVTELEPATVPALASVRDQVERAYRESVAEDIFVQRSALMSELAFETTDLREISDELELEIKSSGPVSRDQADGILAQRGVADAAFSPDVLLDGNNSPLIEVDPNHHLVLRINAYQPQEVMPLVDVTDTIRDLLAREKAIAQARTQAEEMVAMLEDGSLTRYVADQYGLRWTVVANAQRRQAELDAGITETAFGLPRPREGSKSVGYALLDDGDAVVVSVTNVQNKKGSDGIDGLNIMARMLAQQQGTAEYLEWRDGLAVDASISRN